MKIDKERVINGLKFSGLSILLSFIIYAIESLLMSLDKILKYGRYDWILSAILFDSLYFYWPIFLINGIIFFIYGVIKKKKNE